MTVVVHDGDFTLGGGAADGRGMELRSKSASRAHVAFLAVAWLAMMGTDQRLTTSTVVNCLSTTPGSGQTEPPRL